MGTYAVVLGTLLVGVVVNTYLYGIVTHQYLRYYTSRFGDLLRVKASVLLLFSIDTIHTILMVYLCWIYFVSKVSDPTTILTEPEWPLGIIPLGTAITASITHTFLGFRILGMSNKNYYLFGVVIILTLAEFGSALALSIRLWTTDNIMHAIDMKTIVIPWLLIQTSLDILVSASLSALLHRHRTGNTSTDSVINRLIQGAIQTGLFSVVLALAGLIAFLIRPNSILYAMFVIPLGRTYTTTLIHTLNVRARLKERLMNTEQNMPARARNWFHATGTAMNDLETTQHRSSMGSPIPSTTPIPYLTAYPTCDADCHSADDNATQLNTKVPTVRAVDSITFTTSINLAKASEAQSS